MAFSDSELRQISGSDEVRIETRAGSRSFRTIIWIVVDEGEVFVRSVRGEKGKWYQRALANPEVTLHVAGAEIPARAVAATDPSSVERTNEALGRKYKKGRSLDSMLKPEIFGTTMRLDPA
jgi:hypothetical protein